MGAGGFSFARSLKLGGILLFVLGPLIGVALLLSHIENLEWLGWAVIIGCPPAGLICAGAARVGNRSPVMEEQA